MAKRAVFVIAALVLTGCGREHGRHATRAERSACSAFTNLLKARAAALRGIEQAGVDLTPPHAEPSAEQLATYRTSIGAFDAALGLLPNDGPHGQDFEMKGAGQSIVLTTDNKPAPDPRTEPSSEVTALLRFANQCGLVGIRV